MKKDKNFHRFALLDNERIRERDEREKERERERKERERESKEKREGDNYGFVRDPSTEIKCC